MPLPPSARHALRHATAAWHERVDAVFSAQDLADPADYGRFLQAQAAAHLPVERALDAAGIAALLPDWRARRRADLLRDDLAAMGMPLPSTEEWVVPNDTPSLLGAVYVLEGSRLGGTLLARSVGAGLPKAFLTANHPGAWRDLTTLLDARLSSREDVAAATSAACDVFALFEQSGRRYLQGARRVTGSHGSG